VLIVLPLPNKNLSPNARCHWRVKAEKTAQLRYWAGLAAQAAMREPGAPKGSMPWAEATAKVTFYFRTKARRDKDNCAASCKPIWDGFTDAGIWADDSGVTHLPPVLGYDKLKPRVEIEVLQVTAPAERNER
jgi:Holliday junction resolvase RusA-like endonuclease